MKMIFEYLSSGDDNRTGLFCRPLFVLFIVPFGPNLVFLSPSTPSFCDFIRGGIPFLYSEATKFGFSHRLCSV